MLIVLTRLADWPAGAIERRPPVFHFSTLTTDTQFAAFKRSYDGQIAKRSNGRLASVVAIDYLRAASHPNGCFDRNGQLVAGWVVQQGDPLIALNAMPADKRQAFIAATPRDSLCELTAIWRNDGISGNAFAALVWPTIIASCLARRRSCILGIGYRNQMNNIYSIANPRTIYHGPSQSLKDTEVFVYGYTPSALCATFVSNLFARKVLPAARSLYRMARPSSAATADYTVSQESSS